MKIFIGGVRAARFVTLGAVASVLVALSSAAQAAPVELVLGNGSTPAALTSGGAAIAISDYGNATVASFVGRTGSPAITAMLSNGSFDYAFTFSLTSPTTLKAGGVSLNLDLSAALVADVSNGHGGYTIGTTPITPTSSYTPPTTAMPSVLTAGLAAGTYTLELSGALSAGATIGSVTAFVTTVPLPAALPMFAACLAGLAGFGLRRFRRS